MLLIATCVLIWVTIQIKFIFNWDLAGKEKKIQVLMYGGLITQVSLFSWALFPFLLCLSNITDNEQNSIKDTW